MNRKITITITTLAAFLLIIIIIAVWNIKCDRNIERQAKFQYYLHINSKPYKKSLKQDTLFAQRLDSIKLLQHSSFGEGTRNGGHKSLERRDDKVLKFTTHKPYMPK